MVRHFNRFFFYSFIYKRFCVVEVDLKIGRVFPKNRNSATEKIKYITSELLQ